MAHTRRQFIRRGITFVGAGLVAPRLLLGSGSGVARGAVPGSNRILVIVEMAGGNDGLNTVVPYSDSLYYQYRPRLGIRPENVLEIDDRIGLHPSLAPLKALYDQNLVAIVQGVGYTNPNLSHFRSTEIWQTAEPDTIGSTGWIGRYLDQIAQPGSTELDAISVGYETPITLTTSTSASVAAIDTFDSYVFAGDGAEPQDDANKRAAFAGLYDDARGTNEPLSFIASTGLAALSSSEQIREVAGSYTPAVPYQDDPFSQNMLKIAQLAGTGLGTDIYYASLGSFDTHANQSQDQARLLGWLANGLSSFYQDMAAHGMADRILVMTYSEFGRRVNENQSAGTDHGTAGPMFMLGNAVSGGVFGDHPSLEHLDDNYDLIHGIDFRAVYATVLDRWLQTDPEPILGGRFEDLGFL